jgi:hypothetical protein
MVKTYVCRECGVEKLFQEYYSHPLTKDWISHRCKDCVKKWRKTEHELSMSRVRDTQRYYNNPLRRLYVLKYHEELKKRKGYGPIQQRSSKYIRKHWLRPKLCSVCWSDRKIIFHHIDYTNAFLWIFCCDRCHSKIHHNKIEYKDFIIDLKSL